MVACCSAWSSGRALPTAKIELGVFAARPADRLSLGDPDGEFDLERGLDAGADDLAVALAGVAVAEEEQCARARRPGRRRSRPGRSGGSPCCRRTGRWSRSRSPGRAPAPHRSSRSSGRARTVQSLRPRRRLGETSRALPGVDVPVDPLPRRQRRRLRRDRPRSARAPRRSSRCRGSASSGRSAPEAHRPARPPRRRTGPVIGLGASARLAPDASKPQASSVVVITVSPSAT